VGQENTIYPDLLDPQQVLNMRVEVNKQYGKILKEKNNIEGLELGLELAGFQITIPPCLMKEGNIARIATTKEIERIFNEEHNKRQLLAENSKHMQPKFDIDLEFNAPKKSKPTGVSLPVPPPPANIKLPIPPPPPPL
jgi:hypothetical protein